MKIIFTQYLDARLSKALTLAYFLPHRAFDLIFALESLV